MSITGEATVVRLAARGDGVTDDGRHIPLSAPGDRVATDGTVLPGPAHVDPPCGHFPECGGCELQHVAQHAYADFVRERVTNILAGQDVGCDHVEQVQLSPPQSRRRAVLKGLHTASGLVLGFNEGGSHRIVDMQQCEILRPELFALVEPMRGVFAPMLASKRPLSVQMTLVDQGVDLLVKGVALNGLPQIEALSAFAGEYGLARLAVDSGDGPETQWEPEPATITLGGVPVSFPHGAFLQATGEGEAALVAAVLEMLAEGPVADLFAGLGTFALSLPAERAIYAAEADRAAIMALQRAGRQAGRTIFCDHRDLFRRPLQPAELNRFASVILDPPRAGARDQIEQLAKSDVPTIAYVSCNPSSFARDARTLVDAGYRLERLWPVGQFLWSTHVELAASFRR